MEAWKGLRLKQSGRELSTHAAYVMASEMLSLLTNYQSVEAIALIKAQLSDVDVVSGDASVSPSDQYARYWVFAYPAYYPNGGMHDFEGCFTDLEAAIDYAKMLDDDVVEIWDSVTEQLATLAEVKKWTR